MMRIALITLCLMVAGVVGAANHAVQVNSDTSIITSPVGFIRSNDLATVTAVNTTNAVQDAAINSKASTNETAALTATNTAQDAEIAARIATNDAMYMALITNAIVNGSTGSVSASIANITITAAQVGADSNGSASAVAIIASNSTAVLSGQVITVSQNLGTISNLAANAKATADAALPKAGVTSIIYSNAAAFAPSGTYVHVEVDPEWAAVSNTVVYSSSLGSAAYSNSDVFVKYLFRQAITGQYNDGESSYDLVRLNQQVDSGAINWLFNLYVGSHDNDFWVDKNGKFYSSYIMPTNSGNAGQVMVYDGISRMVWTNVYTHPNVGSGGVVTTNDAMYMALITNAIVNGSTGSVSASIANITITAAQVGADSNGSASAVAIIASNSTAVLSGQVITVSQNLGTISNLAANAKATADAALPKAGGTMSGDLDMGSTNTILLGQVVLVSSGSNLTISSGGSNQTVITDANIAQYETPETVYRADGVTLTKNGSTFSVANWIPQNLVDVYFQMLVHQGAAGRSMLDGAGYIYNDQNGILVDKSTNYVWANVGYRNSISSTNIGGGETPTNLVSQWKMNDNTGDAIVTDSVGTNNGTAQQNTSTLHTTGKINGALTFNGSTDYVTFNPDNTPVVNGFSLVLWAFIENKSAHPIFISKWSPYNDWMVGIGGLDGLRIELGQIGFSLEQFVILNIPESEWYHIAFTYSGTSEGIFKVFTNSALAFETNGITLYNQEDVPLVLGCESAEVNQFQGKLDDVRIYSSALSSNDISASYNAGAGTEDTGGGSFLYTTNSMSLVCTNKILDFVPTATWMSILVSGTGATTNDVKGYVSPDYGSNWYEATLTPATTIDMSNTLFQGSVIYTNNTTGTNMIQKTWVSSNGVWKVLGVACPSN